MMNPSAAIAPAVTVVAAVAMLVGVVGCGTSSIAHQTTSTAMPAKATTSAAAQGQSACSDVNGKVGPDQNCHVHASTPTYQVDMSFPLDYPDMQALTDFLKRDRDSFLDWVAKFGPSEKRGRPYLFVVAAKSYRSGTTESGTQSLVLTIDNDTGLAHQGHPNTTFKAFNFDLGKRAPITFATLFKPGAKPLDVLNPIVRGELDSPSADLDEQKYQNFAITNEAVIFFFAQDQVVPDNNGGHDVTVARAELASLLA
jgi:uncharacterized protein DUF3298